MMTAIHKNIRYRNEARLKYGIDRYLVNRSPVRRSRTPWSNRMAVNVPVVAVVTNLSALVPALTIRPRSVTGILITIVDCALAQALGSVAAHCIE